MSENPQTVEKQSQEEAQVTENIESQETTSSESKISICDVMKTNTSKVIHKLESQVPLYTQLYSDYYREYLHTLDDMYGTCYLAEKEFFDRLGFDQTVLKNLDNYWSSITNICNSQIDLSTNFLRTYMQWRISAMKSYDQLAHTMMDGYAKMLSQFNSAFYSRNR